MRGGRGLVRGAVLRGGVRRLVLEERLRRPVLGAPLPLRRGARGLRVAGAARANEGLERQRERPSHLGRRATLTPEAAAMATAAAQEGRPAPSLRPRRHSASPRRNYTVTCTHG